MTTAPTSLSEAAADLLMHHGTGPLTGTTPFVVERDGKFAVAIVLDGWYSSEEWAEAVLDYWIPLQATFAERLREKKENAR
ncbi:MAG: hypothetical protein KDC23_01485 [Actinobacteria bacterium]|nr:hypothetical protein [Actinomycetota bacterium]